MVVPERYGVFAATAIRRGQVQIVGDTLRVPEPHVGR